MTKMQKTLSAPSSDEAKELLDFSPEILAPAGDLNAALAGLAAGADAVYLGLKLFSARMLAENFSILDLARFAELSRLEGKKVYVAMNSFLKPRELSKALRQIKRLVLDVQPNALIVQDMALPLLAREAGFEGEFHFSTLANVSHQAALQAAKSFGASRVVLPRELSLEEMRIMNAACPKEISLEAFVHGALCYCVSGRCWWSSYLGGKSGLRGRCVQPCRRVYTQRKNEGRFFSCLDLAVSDLTQELLPLHNIQSWKIEGRRKSPHYVYHTVKAYRLLRDFPREKAARKEAEELLSFALGRLSVNLLAQEDTNKKVSANSPLAAFKTKRGQSASGLLCAYVEIDSKGKPFINSSTPLQAQDCLRIGYEDEPWHSLCVVQKQDSGKGQFYLPVEKGRFPKAQTPVFLIDRKDQAIQKLLNQWQGKLKSIAAGKEKSDIEFDSLFPQTFPRYKEKVGRKAQIISVDSVVLLGKEAKAKAVSGVGQALWLGRKTVETISKTVGNKYSWWLPPVIWPDEEKHWEQLVRYAYQKGARYFVCNSPWQVELLPKDRSVSAHIGPFCSITNATAIEAMRLAGYKSVLISPELGKEDILSLPKQSSLPLGLVTSGYWPMGLSRHGTLPFESKQSVQSPKKEDFWLRRYGQNVWIYPAWPFDITEHHALLQKAGYSQFIRLEEYPPRELLSPKRVSKFNWDLDVL